MKQSVKLNVSDLQKFCNKAKSVVSNRHTLPILDFILIKEGLLTVTNLETTVMMRIDIDLNFEGTLNFGDTMKLLPSLKGGIIDLSIEVEVEKKGDHEWKTFKATVGTEIGNFSMDVADPNDFPKPPDTGEEAGYLYTADIPLIKKAVSYAGGDDLRPSLNQIRLHNKHVVATDAMALCYYPIVTETAYDLLVSKLVVKLLDEVDYDVNKTEDNVKLTERGGKFTIIYRTLADFPDTWQNIVPLDSSSVVTVKAKDLKEILKAALLVINKNGYFRVNSNPAEGVMTFSCEMDGKKFSRTINVEGAGDPIEIGIAYAYLDKVVQTEKTDEFDFSFLDPSTTIVINDKVLLFPVLIK